MTIIKFIGYYVKTKKILKPKYTFCISSYSSLYTFSQSAARCICKKKQNHRVVCSFLFNLKKIKKLSFDITDYILKKSASASVIK